MFEDLPMDSLGWQPVFSTRVGDVHKFGGDFMPTKLSESCLPKGIEDHQVLIRSWSVL